jgi:hypothetical protein
MPDWNADPNTADDPARIEGPDQDDDLHWTPETEPDPAKSSSNPRGTRRAVLGGLVGVVMLVGPMALVNALVDDNGADVEASEERQTSFLAAVREDTEEAKEANQARMSDALALQPTTTVQKEPVPTTTTTTTAPPTTEAPATTAAPTTQAPATQPAPSSGGDSVWDALAQCESGGNWHINTGNGYYGGLQFTLSTWQSVGGTGYPHEHSRETQIEMGKRLQARAGWGQWPSCASKLGLI